MDISELRSLIEKSTLLSADERAYWIGVLAEMKPEHYSKLEQILTEAAAISLSQHVKEYFSTPRSK